jgi:hypothetical protein
VLAALLRLLAGRSGPSHHQDKEFSYKALMATRAIVQDAAGLH